MNRMILIAMVSLAIVFSLRSASEEPARSELSKYNPQPELSSSARLEREVRFNLLLPQYRMGPGLEYAERRTLKGSLPSI